jgi:peptide-methionine (S)-S-oxide reductase
MRKETASFAAGCFWGIEEEFRQLIGVNKTQAGYAGGKTKNPTYHQVCSGNTGHAETVKVIFDPDMVSYQELLDTFWNSHMPTVEQLEQGKDSQYRSVIFYHSEEQRKLAEISKKKKESELNISLSTEIVKHTNFYPAEEYHQCYLAKQNRKN